MNRSQYLFHQIPFLVSYCAFYSYFACSYLSFSIFLFRWHTIAPVSCSLTHPPWILPTFLSSCSLEPSQCPCMCITLDHVLARSVSSGVCVYMCRCSTPETPGWFLCFWNAQSHVMTFTRPIKYSPEHLESVIVWIQILHCLTPLQTPVFSHYCYCSYICIWIWWQVFNFSIKIQFALFLVV